MSVDLIINQETMITALIAGFSFLVTVCGSLIAILARMLFNKLDKKIDKCSQDLSVRMDFKLETINSRLASIVEYTKETRKSAYHAHDRQTEHIEKHHTNG